MMFCPACGNQMHESAASCPSCGRPHAVAVPGGDVANTSWLGFRGRISRSEYWLHYTLPLAAASAIAVIIDGVLQANGILGGLISLLIVVPSLAGYVKRAHDRDHSGWFLLVGFIPLVGPFWLLIELGFLKGTSGPNRFGRDPLQQALPIATPGPAFT